MTFVFNVILAVLSFTLALFAYLSNIFQRPLLLQHIPHEPQPAASCSATTSYLSFNYTFLSICYSPWFWRDLCYQLMIVSLFSLASFFFELPAWMIGLSSVMILLRMVTEAQLGRIPARGSGILLCLSAVLQSTVGLLALANSEFNHSPKQASLILRDVLIIVTLDQLALRPMLVLVGWGVSTLLRWALGKEIEWIVKAEQERQLHLYHSKKRHIEGLANDMSSQGMADGLIIQSSSPMRRPEVSTSKQGSVDKQPPKRRVIKLDDGQASIVLSDSQNNDVGQLQTKGRNPGAQLCSGKSSFIQLSPSKRNVSPYDTPLRAIDSDYKDDSLSYYRQPDQDDPEAYPERRFNRHLYIADVRPEANPCLLVLQEKIENEQEEYGVQQYKKGESSFLPPIKAEIHNKEKRRRRKKKGYNKDEMQINPRQSLEVKALEQSQI